MVCNRKNEVFMIFPSKHNICITFIQCWTNVEDVLRTRMRDEEIIVKGVLARVQTNDPFFGVLFPGMSLTLQLFMRMLKDPQQSKMFKLLSLLRGLVSILINH